MFRNFRFIVLLIRAIVSVVCLGLTMILIVTIPMAESLGLTRSVLGYGFYFAVLSLFAELFNLGFLIFKGWPEDAVDPPQDANGPHKDEAPVEAVEVKAVTTD